MFIKFLSVKSLPKLSPYLYDVAHAVREESEDGEG